MSTFADTPQPVITATARFAEKRSPIWSTEPGEIRRNGAVIDPDTAAMLSGAAYQLQGLPDSAVTLSKAADQLNAAANHWNGLQ